MAVCVLFSRRLFYGKKKRVALASRFFILTRFEGEFLLFESV